MSREQTTESQGANQPPSVPLPARLLTDIRGLIENARQDIARSINSGLVLLYWNIGRRIRKDILKGMRASYGDEIVSALGRQLTAEFGRGFGKRNLFRMIRLAEVFPDFEIVSSLMTQLSWTHFLHIIVLDDPLQRDFYAEMCRLERWSTRTLEKKIRGMLYERTALSKKPQEVIEHEIRSLREEDKLTPDLIFRDPYILDFLGLNDRFFEKDLEDAILREIERFILELGVGFSFVARQKRIQLDDEDIYLDLLFFHRKLRRLVAIDLKLGRFKAEHKGQMELYLRWLEEYEQQPGEEPPIGLILCAGKSDEKVKLLRMDDGNIRAATYMTELPPKRLLEQKLRDAVELARRRLEEGKQSESR
jgi:predicted nuclease of restriction endonuclease-like (RecB) superfamily